MEPRYQHTRAPEQPMMVHTLHRYLLRQVIATLVMTVLVFTFILLLGESLKEVFSLLVNGQVGIAVVGQALLLLIPFVLIYALPMGFLTAMLLVFGRFSADNELTASKSCGVSLASLAPPILGLALVCSALCAWINLEIAPKSRNAYKQLLFKAGSDSPLGFLPERTFVRDLKDYIFYASKVEGTNLEDVLIYRLDQEGRKKDFLRADRGRVTLSQESRQLTITLTDGWQMFSDFGTEPAWHSFAELDLPPIALPTLKSEEKPRLSNMTWKQLRQELDDLEKQLLTTLPVGKVSSGELQQRLAEAKETAIELTEPVRVQIHRQISFSFACIGFALVGIPLGIRSHRRETSVGFALSLILVVVYYSFFVLAQTLETRANMYPHLLVWIPNLLFQFVGGVLLWRANTR